MQIQRKEKDYDKIWESYFVLLFLATIINIALLFIPTLHYVTFGYGIILNALFWLPMLVFKLKHGYVTNSDRGMALSIILSISLVFLLLGTGFAFNLHFHEVSDMFAGMTIFVLIVATIGCWNQLTSNL